MDGIATECLAPDRTRPRPGGPGVRPAPAGAPPLVFLVDDDALLRLLVGDWIEAAGYRTLRLPDGASCLSALARHRPAAVILDLHMAGLSGRDTLEFIRIGDPALPVIAMTAEGNGRAIADLLDAGADDVLRKPVDPGRLSRALREAAGAPRARVPA